MHGVPFFQLAGVATLRVSVTMSESIARRTSLRRSQIMVRNASREISQRGRNIRGVLWICATASSYDQSFLSFADLFPCLFQTHSKFLPVVAGYSIESFIFRSFPIMNTARHVRGIPSASFSSGSSIPSKVAISRFSSAMMGYGNGPSGSSPNFSIS